MVKKMNIGKEILGETKAISQEKLAALFEAYKEANPVKAAKKKAEFERKLAALEK